MIMRKCGLTVSECIVLVWAAILFFVSAAMIYDLSVVNFYGWIGIFGNAVMYSALFGALLFLVGGKRLRWVVLGLFLYLFIVDCALLFARVNFDMQLDGSWLAIVLGTSEDELRAFFEMYFGIKCVLILIASVVCLWGIVKLCHSLVTAEPNLMKRLLGLGLIVVFVALHPIFMGSIYKNPMAIFYRTPAFALAVDTIRNWNMYRDLAKMEQEPVLPQKLTQTFSGNNMFGVVVVGESATRNHMSAYGYGRATTPGLDRRKSEIVLFDDCVSPASSTSPCLRYIFTRCEVEGPNELKPTQCTLSQAFSAAGCRTVLYSRQKRLGAHCGVEPYAFAGCDEQVYLDELDIPKPFYDEELLKFLDGEIDFGRTNSVVFLHFLGSHIPASWYYPPEKARFHFEKVVHASELVNDDGSQNQNGINDYDNSIAYSDEVLEKIIQRCECLDRPAWVIYLSDHGETPNAKGWRVVSHRDLWEVPLVFWFNRRYRELHPDVVKLVEKACHVPLQSDQLFVGLLRVGGVKCDDTDGPLDFLSNHFARRAVRMMQGGRETYRWQPCD